jgi:glycosyltransferase involved in cell wall biosynthesis
LSLAANTESGTIARPRVLAVASHPIQYQTPWFRALANARAIEFSVLFIQQPDPVQQGQGFGVPFQWDIPLLEGYCWERVPELRGHGGLHGFFAARIRRPFALLRRLRPDVVLLTGWHTWPMLQVLIAAWWVRIPVVMRAESNALRRRAAGVRVSHRWLLGRCAAFLPIGRSSRAFYRGYGIADARLFDAPYFVDNARFTAAAAENLPRRAQLRERWHIPAEATCFCYAGKLEPKKRILDLLAALRIAVAQCPRPLHLLVVGTGALMPKAQAFAAEHRLPVTFAGFLNQTEIPPAYVAADCLVLPSDYGETWGLVVNEAMACGRPAIVSDRVGCGPDLVREGETGAVFPFGDVAALAQRMVLLADRDRLQALGVHARAQVLAAYTVERAAESTLRAVQYVLGDA